ncbi:MAG TPA: Gfo/Idh/MocA family oxidoreductase [Candidatus Handelsmanbacteria bacterium]|nr:Gfo/Idh/MocA family oxidoreductase [Candidatus Handelsmanbacteria bacterium]
MPSIDALMIGTGEYTTGYVHSQASESDKSAGVVALSLFDMRRLGKLGRIAMAGTNGTKFPGIRQHFQRQIAEVYRDMDMQFQSFPGDDVSRDPNAYQAALDTMSPGDLVTIFTPDDTHGEIALAAIERGLHVLVTKPPVKTLKEHRILVDAARRKGVLVAVEVHKRWDPIYVDARDRIRALGDFSYFASYMSQPKQQLETFRHWAGKSSDISYYLNSHHIDFHSWAVQGRARPLSVVATASTGCAWAEPLNVATEDTITLTVQWENLDSGNLGTAVYTASWIAPTSDVHSQQRFFYMGHAGEVTVDQAHRGYTVATDESGYASANPLFMKYTPDADGNFVGQTGYGYRSFEAFVDAVHAIHAGSATPDDFDGRLATIGTTQTMTAILEAGRRSLDSAGRPQRIAFDDSGQPQSIAPDPS